MSGDDTYNTAGDGAFVGVQAGQVHNSDIYVVHPGDPPERDYEVGCNYLSSGVPSKAREYVERARARGLTGPEVDFHLALAVLSKRSYRDLTEEDRAVLRGMAARRAPAGRDPWKRGLDAVFALLSCVDGSGSDTGAASAALESLPAGQRDLILRHLDLILTGGVKQSMWNRLRENAAEARSSKERADRVWAYFEAEPAGARARAPLPVATGGRDVFLGVLSAAAAVGPVLAIAVSALSQGDLTALVASLCVFAFGPVAWVHMAAWHHGYRRRVDLEYAYGYNRAPASPPEGGFADRVGKYFDDYFTRYAPDPADAHAWLARTRGVRRRLRDEVVQVYRDQKVEADQVKWLIRFLARDTRRHLSTGASVAPHRIHRVDPAVKAKCVAACLAAIAALAVAAVSAFPQAPVSTAAFLVVAVAAAGVAIPLWLRIDGEHRRFKEETREYREAAAARTKEYQRWKSKLDRLRPTEEEMEAWLNADKALILDEALQTHRLGWHEVVAHAFLTTPKRPCRSARRHRGAWRYSRYEIRVFLVTEEGVRESTVVLDFSRSRWRVRSRKNYRFDAVSSVHVEITSKRRYTLNVTLSNGPTESIVVSEDATLDPAAVEEHRDDTPNMDLDAAGFFHALRVLEGIAAEGRPWFGRAADPHSADPSDPSAAA